MDLGGEKRPRLSRLEGHLAVKSSKISVFLPATKCANGVIQAIQSKIPVAANDIQFLRNLISNNALDICIDGLNEVTPDTRATISHFVERHFKGHILITTQPLDWISPATTRTYILQPLKRKQIKEFLLSRQEILPSEMPISGIKYEEACEDYLQEALNPQQNKEELNAVRRFLSNPMDLTIVAQMLAQGKHPDLLNLQQQQYEIMATQYQEVYLRPFPLAQFAETAYQMRLNDEITIPTGQYQDELHCLETI